MPKLLPTLLLLCLAACAGSQDRQRPVYLELAEVVSDGSAEGLRARVLEEFEALGPILPEDTALLTEDGPPQWRRDTPLHQLDFSGVSFTRNASPGTPPGKRLRGTLISDRHAIVSGHIGARPGQTMSFLTRNNDLIEREVAKVVTIADLWTEGNKVVPFPEVKVVRLARPVPPDVAAYPLLDVGRKGVFQVKGSPLPAFLTNQDGQAVPALYVARIKDGTRAAFAPYGQGHAYMARGGDSGYPIFTLIDGQLVLVSHHWFAGFGEGPNYFYGPLLDAIEDAVRESLKP